MVNKENYVPWSSRLLRYAKSRPNGKLIYNSIMNGPYVEADDQAILTILLGLPEDIYATVNNCETAQEIWLRVQQMMKGSDIGIQEKKAKLFNEWERFTSTDGESVESYYHRFSKLMNDFKRNKHFPEKIASNLKFLNNLQPEWSRHVTIVHQTKYLHTTNYTQLYDFLKYNQKEVNDLRAERLAKTQDPLALMANSYNPFNYPVFHPDLPSSNPATVMNMTLVLMAKAFKLNYSTPTNNNQRIHQTLVHRQIAQAWNDRNQVVQKQFKIQCSSCWKSEIANLFVRIANQKGNEMLKKQESNLMAATTYIDEIKEVNANCILIANLQQASTSGTQTDKAPVYDSDGSVEIQLYENCYDNDIFNIFTQEEQTRGGTVEQHPATVEETRAYFESLYNNLAIEVEKVNTVNRKLRETNADLTTELVRYKNQEMCLEISQEKYDKLERCYQKSVYQEQCLTKKINALHLSSSKQITTLNEEISNLNNQLSKEKSTVSSLQEEYKRLKSDFKIREDELLYKQIQLENKIKELTNILVKTGQSIQMMHMLSPKPDSFYHTEQKIALGYQNPFYLKQTQQKQQSLYNGKVLLEKHDPPAVYASEEIL
ncbi:hypothetical protein Tco_1012734 [Tanacetum coccineum]